MDSPVSCTETTGAPAEPGLKVILIGGTSHAGKSTLAALLGDRLGWICRSTDKLARHPGRPWRTPPDPVADHVREHYLARSPDELVADVLRHYRDNVWPLVRALVAAHAGDASPGRLVLEGSAILPELAAEVMSPHVAVFWLVPSDDCVERRILANSRYTARSPEERILIDRFVARTLGFNDRLRAELARHGLPSWDPGDALPDAAGIDACLGRLNAPVARDDSVTALTAR